jgi:hypothetical protein
MTVLPKISKGNSVLIFGNSVIPLPGVPVADEGSKWQSGRDFLHIFSIGVVFDKYPPDMLFRIRRIVKCPF